MPALAEVFCLLAPESLQLVDLVVCENAEIVAHPFGFSKKPSFIPSVPLSVYTNNLASFALRQKFTCFPIGIGPR